MSCSVFARLPPKTDGIANDRDVAPRQGLVEIADASQPSGDLASFDRVAYRLSIS